MLKNASEELIEFDLNSLQTVTRDGTDNEVLMLTESEQSFSDSIGYQLGIFSLNEETTKAMIIKNQLLSDSILLITYYNLDGKVLQEVEINNDLQTISFLIDSKYKLVDCGNEVLDCMKTMYWEMGWGSVSWWVGQAIFGAPWALGTVIGCGAAMCIL